MGAGEEGDVVHELVDVTTKARADVLGLAADSADRSIMVAVIGGYNPEKSVKEAGKGPIRGTV